MRMYHCIFLTVLFTQFLVAGSYVANAKQTTRPEQGVANKKVLKSLVSKLNAIGQKRTMDLKIAKFLKLKEKQVAWHSKFDSERDIQVFEDKKKPTLVLTVPEKAFPEFGKTWLYVVDGDGKVLKAGVCDPMGEFAPYTDKATIRRNAKSEIDYWIKELLGVNAALSNISASPTALF